METIVRYDNRKLYSNTHSKYITLDYLNDLVNINKSFQVVEHKTGEVITNKTLVEILKKRLTNKVKSGTLSHSDIVSRIKGL